MIPLSARAVGYVRVSTEQQADSGLGLQVQEAAVRAAASRLGVELVRVFVDAGTSGGLGIEDRPVCSTRWERFAVAMCCSWPNATVWDGM